MKKNCFARALSLILVLSLTACAASVPTDETANRTDEDAASTQEVTPLSADTDGETQLRLAEDAADALSLAVGENGELFVASQSRSVARYAADGRLERSYSGTGGVSALQATDGYVYGVRDKDLVRFDVKTGALETLYGGLDVIRVYAFALSDGRIYIAASTAVSYGEVPAADGYMGYGEKLLVFDMEHRTLEEQQPVKNLITFYQSEDGRFWLYAHPESRYELYEYDPVGGKAKKISEMDDAGYTQHFVYEDDTFVFLSMPGQVRAMDVKTGHVYDVSDAAPAYRDGSCFTRYGGRIYFLETTADTNGHGGFISRLHTLTRRDGVYEDGAPVQKRLVIANLIDDNTLHNLIDLDEMERRSGIRVTTIDNNHLDESAYLTSLMAGDNEADIYVVKGTYGDIGKCLGNMGYVPLNGSEKITAFLDGCFDWVHDAVTLSNGDIAMFPLWFDLPAVWCSEQLFDSFGLTAEDFSTFDKALETNERILREKGDYTTLIHHQDSFWNLLLQYESVYCDYENGEADFKTEAFTHLFDQLFTGWTWRGNFHPVMEYDWNLMNDADREARLALREKGVHWLDFEFYPHNNIYTVIRSRYFMNMDLYRDSFFTTDSPIDVEIRAKCLPPRVEGNWRVLPMPRINDAVTKNLLTQEYWLVVNPHSTKTDLAIEYLESVTEDIHSATYLTLFIQKDPAAYAGYYDMAEPVWQDVYAIFENAEAYAARLSPRELWDSIEGYEKGILTLDEAVAEIDRRARYFAGE